MKLNKIFNKKIVKWLVAVIIIPLALSAFIGITHGIKAVKVYAIVGTIAAVACKFDDMSLENNSK
jgi:hypothetical protein